ncbi:MAG: hypothetical protein K0R94_795 [Burkholderiales bacterium]|nr:hypothetical protein [Burkholderiales bacterium]
MENNLPDIYIMHEDGTEQLLKASKMRFEFKNSAKVTIEVNKRDVEEIIVRGYHGNEEYKPSEQSVILCMRGGGANLISIKPELKEISNLSQKYHEYCQIK